MTQIQNLLERAKPELLKAIAQYKVDYPATAEHVERTLMQNCFVTDIPFGTMNNLDNICRSANVKFKFDNPYILFNDLAKVVS
jgi:hypothetical protein